MRTTLPFLFLLAGCPAIPTDTASTDSGDPADTGADTGDTANDTADDTSDTSDTGKDTSDTADTGGDTGGDTADTGDTSDTSTDTGDTSIDTGDTADTAPDTGDTSSTGCTSADLILSAEVRDSTGVAGTTFTPKDALDMVGVVTNLCPMDVTFSTTSTCLFTGWSVTSSSGMGTGVAVACAGVVTSWTVTAGGTLEESQPWGRSPADSYSLTVTADIPAASASVAYTVK